MALPEGLHRGASTARRLPEPPPGLAEFARRVIAHDADMAPVLVDQTFLRALLRYVRRLERDVEEMGEFW